MSPRWKVSHQQRKVGTEKCGGPPVLLSIILLDRWSFQVLMMQLLQDTAAFGLTPAAFLAAASPIAVHGHLQIGGARLPGTLPDTAMG